MTEVSPRGGPDEDGVPRKPAKSPAPPARRGARDVPGDPGLRGIASWPLPVTVLLVVLVGAGVVAGAYWLVALLAPLDPAASLTAAQRLTAAFATATALGAMVALVVNVRRQDLSEQAARREIASAFTERFRAAASQLGGVSPAERLAGVYAMAALADEYPGRRQQCVDVLCGYLRLPFDPDTDHLAAHTTDTTRSFADGKTVTTRSTTAARPFDGQVRHTIVAVIRNRTQPDAAPSWSALDFDFTGAHLHDADLTGAQFVGTARFERAQFTGDAWFERARFSHTAWFGGAQFAGTARFQGTQFTDDAGFVEARFTGDAWFRGARFSTAWFGAARFTGDAWFERAQFTGDASFGRAQFTGDASFEGAQFTGDTGFVEARFTGDAGFDGAQFTGDASFERAEFPRAARFEGAGFVEGRVHFWVEGVQREDLVRWGATFSDLPAVSGSK